MCAGSAGPRTMSHVKHGDNYAKTLYLLAQRSGKGLVAIVSHSFEGHIWVSKVGLQGKVRSPRFFFKKGWRVGRDVSVWFGFLCSLWGICPASGHRSLTAAVCLRLATGGRAERSRVSRAQRCDRKCASQQLSPQLCVPSFLSKPQTLGFYAFSFLWQILFFVSWFLVPLQVSLTLFVWRLC